LRFSDFPIVIGLRKNNRNIGLAKLSDFKYRTSKPGLPIAIGIAERYGQKERFSYFSLYFFTKFCSSDEFLRISAKTHELLASVLFLASLLLLALLLLLAPLLLVACLLMSVCLMLLAAAGVFLVSDVLTVAWIAFAGVPGIVGFPAVAFIPVVAFIPAVAGVSAVAVTPAVDGVFRHPYVIVTGKFTYCTIQ
jgi:hypothetical protein